MDQHYFKIIALSRLSWPCSRSQLFEIFEISLSPTLKKFWPSISLYTFCGPRIARLPINKLGMRKRNIVIKSKFGKILT